MFELRAGSGRLDLEAAMDSSIATADPRTHIKIMTVALLLAMAITAIMMH